MDTQLALDAIGSLISFGVYSAGLLPVVGVTIYAAGARSWLKEITWWISWRRRLSLTVAMLIGLQLIIKHHLTTGQIVELTLFVTFTFIVMPLIVRAAQRGLRSYQGQALS